MKRLSFLLFSILSLNAFAQDECFQVLSLSSRNYTDTETKSIMASNIYKSYCGSSSSNSSINLGIDSNETAKLVSSVFGIKANSSDATMKQFCDNYNSGMYGKQEFTQSTNIVVEDAIKAWAQCQKLKNEDVSFQINDGGHQITFTIKQTSGRTINLTGVNYNPKCLKCEISKGKETVVADKFSSEKIKDGKYLNIVCARIKAESDSIVFYPNTDISINTDLGSLTIPIPEKATPKYIWLSEIIDALEDQKENSIRRENMLQAQIDSLNLKLKEKYFNKGEIIFGRFTAKPSHISGLSNPVPRLRNLFSQSDGEKGIAWFSLKGNDSGIFENGVEYQIHMITEKGHFFLGNFEYGKNHSELNLERMFGIKGSITFIAIKNKA